MTTASLAALAKGLAGTAGVLMVALLADWSWRPGGGGLVVLAGSALVAALGIPTWTLWSFRSRPTDRQVARLIEERCPELEDRLAAAAHFSEQPSASPLHGLLMADAASRVRDLEIDEVVSRSALKRSALQAAGATAAVMAIGVVALEPATRAVEAVSLYAFPHRVTLTVLPGDAKVVAGETLRIEARFANGAGPMAGVIPTVAVQGADESESADMIAVPEGFELNLGPATEDFTYAVSAAAVASPEYRVTVLHPPRIERIDVEYRYPAFTGLVPRVEEDGGDVYAPAGTDVTLRVHVDKPVRSGAVVMAGGERIEMGPRAGRVVEAELHIAVDGSYRVAVSDLDDLTNPGETEYFIRVMADRPPDVRIMRPAGDREITPLEEVTIEARADDDFGLEHLELVVSVRGGPEEVVRLADAGQARTLTGGHVLYAEDLGLQPGDFVTYYARAQDVSRGKRATEARSDIFFLEVTPFDAEFTAAQSQSMMGGGGRSIDDLVTAQKEIIVATWKLDRRADAGGRSEDDIKSIGRAQGELRARAEQAAQRIAARSPRGLTGRPQRGGAEREGGGHPLEAAAAAMARAETALDTQDTSEALPHEMEALNQLLKAQAEVREQQVARQEANGGGGGSNRSNQDLSALFDRELRRQQETNYETRDSATQREPDAESEALERVRELAKRQDELSRQQRDLASQQAQLEAEELKRRLERLTREQAELRQRAEELAQQLSDTSSTADGATGRGEDTSASGLGRRGLEAASEEMRGATSELRRQQLEEAATRGEQAADRLRELEEQMLGRVPEARRRALGEMQLEAQQLAEAQRRVANETSRLEAERLQVESVRRLAEEQERLARRTEALENELNELAGATDETTVREALAAAGRALAERDVERRMEESAAAMRALGETGERSEDAAGTAAAADDDALARLAVEEAALADDLGLAAGRLAEAGNGEDPEGWRLSEQLARVQELQARLDDLQRRLQEREDASGSPDESGRAPGKSAADADAEKPGESSGQAARGSDVQGEQPGAPATNGPRGSQGQAGESGEADLNQLVEEYAKELREAQAMIDEARRDNPGLGGTPETHRFSQSAPGVEAFKQDRSAWTILRHDVSSALELLESALSERLSRLEARDRLKAGPDARPPGEYEKLVELYYQSLASTNRN